MWVLMIVSIIGFHNHISIERDRLHVLKDFLHEFSQGFQLQKY